MTGSRPPWWRPFARRKWDRAVRAAAYLAFEQAIQRAWAQVWERLAATQEERKRQEEGRLN